VIALVTLLASLPLAVAWFHQTDRPAWPGYVLAAGALRWAAILTVVVLLARELA
jgi:hypothetical protein